MLYIVKSAHIDHGFKPWSGQTKNSTIGICDFSAYHPALRSNNKYCLAQNQDNVSEWRDMSTRRLLFQ